MPGLALYRLIKMPDILGRLNLKEMRLAVWRNLAAVYPSSVDVATGSELLVDPMNPDTDSIISHDPLFTKQDIDRKLNESLTARSLDLIANAENTFADEETVDVVANIMEYPTPDDMAFLRGCWWKDPGIPKSQVPFSKRIFMHQVDEGSLDAIVEYNGAPTYRRQLDLIFLNEAPLQDNPGGILFRYIKWVNHLQRDDQVLETEYARILQEIITLEAAVWLASRKSFLDTTEMRQDLQTWENRLVIAARQSDSPPFRYMTVRHPLSAFRRRRSRWFR